MKKQLGIALAILALIAVVGYYFLAAKNPPSVSDIRANPALFDLADYPDRIDLHTRLSLLFPRGSSQQDLSAFLSKAGILQTDETFYDCTHKIEYGRMALIYNFPQKTLAAIQVEGWPNFNEYCKASAPVPKGEKPVKLPLMPLPNGN
ncbi:MAG: hypothetical protein ACLFR0_08820 [Alphaproteobacteria bacterium]